MTTTATETHLEQERQEARKLATANGSEKNPARLAELISENKKARDYVLFIAATAKEGEYAEIVKNLREAKDSSTNDGEKIVALATVLAMALWLCSDNYDADEVAGLLEEATATGEYYSLLGLCIRGQEIGMDSFSMRGLCVEAEVG